LNTEIFPIDSVEESRGVELQLRSFLTLTLDGGECSRGNPRRPLNRRLGGHQSRSGRFGKEKKLLSLLEFEPRTVYPVV
jgi:hypothetical protein